MKCFFSKGKLVLLSFLFGLFTFAGTAQQILTKINGLNAYVHLPDDYDQTNKTYPVIIFFPGAGHVGKNEKDLLEFGPSKFIDEGHNMQFMVNGVLEKPIVMSIQPLAAFPPPHHLDAVFNAVMANWRIDPKRFHVTGISQGGFCGNNYVTQSAAYASRITSIVAMSAVIPNNPISNFKDYAEAGGKWWGFEGTFDYRFMDKIRDVMNETVPGSARYTSYVGGHGGWNKWYDPEWKEEGLSIYEWMLGQTKETNTNTNQWPVAHAGSDRTITLPENSLMLNGGASYDADGKITSYLWEKISGPPQYTIANKDSVSTTVSDLRHGAYVFQLSVTDERGASSRDQVIITVNSKPRNNEPPVANAGSDLSITLPVTQVTLSGSGSDADGSVSGFSWKQSSGPGSSTIENAANAVTVVSGLTAPGLYEFLLTVTDDEGATGASSVKVTVYPPTTSPNQPPVANAGPDITITLPVSEAVLNGSGSDADGHIVAFAWQQVSGPSLSVIENAGQAATGVHGLTVAGVYEFRLTITDNEGATASSVAKVNVLAEVPVPNKLPVANAGPDLSITLPATQVTLSGSGSDPDGTITGYHWEQQGGPATSVIGNPSNAVTVVSGLTEQGVYVFALTVTDNTGATATSTVKVTVYGASRPPNQAPVAHAGTDLIITLPISGTTLAGSGVDPDGTVDGYSWKQQAGPSTAVITSPVSAVTTVNGLSIPGQYLFMLTVTDNEGATGSAVVRITVQASQGPPNRPPWADAGPDITLTLPVNAFTLAGKGADSDGFIESYSWVKTQGSKKINILNPGSASTVISGVEQGVYELVLTVTDNLGLSARDTVVITVNGTSPIARAPKTNSSFSQGFSVYPNPALDIVNVRLVADKKGEMKLTIYQINGTVVYSANYEKETETFTRSISIANLLSGIYVVELRFADGEAFKVQVMKQ